MAKASRLSAKENRRPERTVESVDYPFLFLVLLLLALGLLLLALSAVLVLFLRKKARTSARWDRVDG